MRPLFDQNLHVGYGQADLKAPLGGSMPGYFRDRKANGTHDPLLAKALILQQGETHGAIISVDLVNLCEPEVIACREAVERLTGIPGRNVWVHATHTHTGMMIPRKFTSDAEEFIPDFYPGEVDPDWTAALPGRVAEAVLHAVTNAAISTVDLGETEVHGVAFYRRFRMNDGNIVTNPGRNNPNAVEPAGEIDPILTVLRFPEAKAIVAIYGLHPDVIGGTEFSADYPYFLTHRVKEQFGEDWGVLFLNAACGNINHIDVKNPDQSKGFEESERIGNALGDGVAEALKEATPIEVETLGFASRVVPSRIRTVPEKVVQEAEAALKNDPEGARGFNTLYAPAAVALGRTKERDQRAEISAMRLGPVALVGVPGEIFVELAREVQHASPFDRTRVIGLTNGALGYIPHAQGYEEGGYESGYRSARFEPRTGHRWAETAIQLLNRLA